MTSSAVLIKQCRLCNTVQRTEWSPWKSVRQKQSLNNNLFNVIKCTAACHCHDANPYCQINGEEKIEREGETTNVTNHQSGT